MATVGRVMRAISAVLGIIGGVMTMRAALLRRRQSPARVWLNRMRRRVM
ncbi:MAG: hypothetical protein QJR01_00085 [Kyrpidia sp.]|nr:hypothetical protein [Kyrpidia sp.]